MLTFLGIARHTPEMCSLHNEASQKTMIAWLSKSEELTKKHGIKIVGGWNVHSEHLTIQVLEAPTFEATQAYSMEPENMAMLNWNTLEIKVAMTLEETAQMMMQKMQAKA
jgi:hypothetical protein